MASHRRTTPLLRLLVRLGWQRDRDLWTVRYRDEHGRQARMLVHLDPMGVSLTGAELGTAQLTPWQAEQLRAALREAVLDFGELAGPSEPYRWPGLTAPEPAPPSPAGPPGRERVQIVSRPVRPTVAQIARRLAAPPTPEPQDRNDHAPREAPRPARSHDRAAARACPAVHAP